MTEQARQRDREIEQVAPSQDDADWADSMVEEASRIPDDAEAEIQSETSDQVYDETRERGYRR